jgi:hypothetical protein
MFRMTSLAKLQIMLTSSENGRTGQAQIITRQQFVLEIRAYRDVTVQVVMTGVVFVIQLHVHTSYANGPFFPPAGGVAFLSKPVIAASCFAASLGNMRPRRV